MDVIILCGGKGSRLSEETVTKPKPMVEIGGKPILWHIMKYYSMFGFNRFILALGYKSFMIKEYFFNLRLTGSDFTIKLNPNDSPTFYNNSKEKDWEITFVDTGEETLKGGRIKRIEKYVKSEDFHLTYGDGLSNINISELTAFHKDHGKLATVSAVRPPSRFGEMILDGNNVLAFDEKPQMNEGYINGGFFVLNKRIFEYLSPEENCDFEFGPLQQVVKDNQLQAFIHNDFWQCMDNIRERDYLDKLVNTKKAPWIIWND
jgi:glucose-1-phosphate cytidylyltransferase